MDNDHVVTSVHRPRQMDSFVFDDISSMIQNEATERIISPMSVRLCHLLISMEKADVEEEAFGSLEKTAEDLAEATEALVEKARRLAADSGEQWLRAEVEPAAESLLLCGRNVTQVARKLLLQPACQRHREELATMAQQMVVATTKVLLLEDAATARRAALEAGCCLSCLDALEATDDAASLSRLFADLAMALLRLGHLTARRGEADGLLRGCIPALVAVARGHLRYPRDPQLAASRRRVLAQTREALSKLLALLEPSASSFPAQTLSRSGALTRRLQQVRELLLATPTPGCLNGLLDAPLAAVLGHCMYLAAGCAPPERLHLVVRCRQLLELRGSLGAAETGRASLDSAEERAALWAAAEGLSQGIRTGLLSQILDTFTDTQSPLQSLIQAARVTPPEDCLRSGETSPTSLQPFLAVFLEQAGHMLRVAHLVLVCCSRPQTGRDLEIAAAGLWALVVRVQQFFSQDPRNCDLDLSPDALQALLQAWAAASDHLLSCFDDVLDIPEFLSACIWEMTRRLPFLAWALSSGDPTELRRPVVYLQARAVHMVQVMNRYVGRERDPIFRNGLRVLIQQLAQASRRLGAAAEDCSEENSLWDTGVVLAAARQLICSAQSILEGLDGTNHPDILSPLRVQVCRFGTTEDQPCLVLPGLWDGRAPELKHQQVPGFRERDPGTFCSPRVHPACPSIPGMDPPGGKEDSRLSAINKLVLAVQRCGPEGSTSAGFSLPEQGAGQEPLAGEGLLGSERMPGLQEVSTLPPCLWDNSLMGDIWIDVVGGCVEELIGGNVEGKDDWGREKFIIVECETQTLDLLWWEWAATAHSAMAQLQAWKGSHSEAWRLLAQCLKPGEDPVLAPVQDLAQPGLYHKAGTTGTEAQHNGLPAASPGHPAWPQTELAQSLQKDDSADNDNRLSQITQEMTEMVLRMAQSLRKRCLLTKDELITSARKVATCAQEFARLICMIAKNCIDRRCSQELVCRVEQIQTMSNQLRIISSVKASLARSRSSEELLVGNAQQLLQAVREAVRAAEAASLRGLRSPPHNPEESEVAALCMQWRKRLVKHRLQETSTRDWDEWGLRKASTEMPPTLAALIQS
ncbi:uncharacterized protein LOC121164955 [Ochotona curzoniae]|uniref:uncharacterized protein LOC121164955 n=1 Tax=Ochotona curzoniae TaxID=130825 RepID=UPI001B351C37|nr:uncharacterized protein LOC121164955 [Ochotona curzoniae]